MERKAWLIRGPSQDVGTFGVLILDDGTKLYSAELQWQGNKPNISCIPSGSYQCQYLWSDKHQKNVYHVQNVSNRSVIEIHSGNWAGDTSKGQKSNLLGCIAPGTSYGPLENQEAVLNSTEALEALEAAFNHQPFTLKIEWSPCSQPDSLC